MYYGASWRKPIYKEFKDGKWQEDEAVACENKKREEESTKSQKKAEGKEEDAPAAVQCDGGDHSEHEGLVSMLKERESAAAAATTTTAAGKGGEEKEGDGDKGLLFRDGQTDSSKDQAGSEKGAGGAGGSTDAKRLSGPRDLEGDVDAIGRLLDREKAILMAN